MALSEARKRANLKYDKEHMRSVAGLKFSPNEYDLADWIASKPNKAGYIKQLVREDMERHQKQDD